MAISVEWQRFVIVPNLSFAEVVQAIAPILDQWTDSVVPREVLLVSNNRYAPVYAWMFSYERQLKYRLEAAWQQQLGRFERRLFGPDGAVSEALSNAFVHGHRRDPTLEIRVTVAPGKAGVAFSITDQGQGFDVHVTLNRLAGGRGHFSIAGNGLRALARRDDVLAAFADSGRTLHLAVELWSPCSNLWVSTAR